MRKLRGGGGGGGGKKHRLARETTGFPIYRGHFKSFCTYGEEERVTTWQCRRFPPYLEIPMDDTVGMAMIDGLQDLLDAVRGVGLGVELPGHDVLEQLATGHTEKVRGQIRGQQLSETTAAALPRVLNP